MLFSCYMVCPNAPICDDLHQTMCDLFHYLYIPIMCPANHTNGDRENTFASTMAMILSHSQMPIMNISLFPFISFFLIGFWFGKRRPTTALYYDGSEITALFHGAFKTIQLHSCDSSFGSPLTSPVHTFEDNQGTIKLIHLKVACTKTSIMLLTALQSLLIVPN